MGASGKSSPVVPDVVEEHLDEFTFLSLQRRKLLFSHEAPQAALKRHDDRIAAHWDGLAVAGAYAVELAVGRLAGDDPWDVAAAARVWVVQGRPDGHFIVERIAKARDGMLPSWKEALRGVPSGLLTEIFPDGLLVEAPPKERSVLVDAFGWHGLLPTWTYPINSRNDDSRVRTALARTIGWAPSLPEAEKSLDSLLRDGEESVRRPALWSLSLRRPADGATVCRKELSTGRIDPFTFRVLGIVGSPEDSDLLGAFIGSRETIAVLHALGDLGGSRGVPALESCLGREEGAVRDAAAAALRRMLGDVVWSTGGSSTPDEAEAQLRPDTFKAWWNGMAERFPPGKKILRGRPFPEGWEPAESRPMEVLWRMAVLRIEADPCGLAREVPDGFFAGRDEDEAVPGE